MTLRQRWEQWKERDRIIRRMDLSVAEKVAVLQGNMLEPFLRRTVKVADSMRDLGIGINHTTRQMQRLNEVLAVYDESSVITDEGLDALNEMAKRLPMPGGMAVTFGRHTFDGDLQSHLAKRVEVTGGTSYDGLYDIESIELKPEENRTEWTLTPVKKTKGDQDQP